MLIGVAVAAGALVAIDSVKTDNAEPATLRTSSSATDFSKPPPAEQRSRTLVAAARRDPFSAPPTPKPPEPAPVVTVEAAPAPPPSAPPLPFKYFGRVKGINGKLSDFVERENQLIAVATGETIEDVYRVEHIDDAEIVFLHVPTQQRQSLAVTPQ